MDLLASIKVAPSRFTDFSRSMAIYNRINVLNFHSGINKLKLPSEYMTRHTRKRTRGGVRGVQYSALRERNNKTPIRNDIIGILGYFKELKDDISQILLAYMVEDGLSKRYNRKSIEMYELGDIMRTKEKIVDDIDTIIE